MASDGNLWLLLVLKFHHVLLQLLLQLLQLPVQLPVLLRQLLLLRIGRESGNSHSRLANVTAAAADAGLKRLLLEGVV